MQLDLRSTQQQTSRPNGFIAVPLLVLAAFIAAVVLFVVLSNRKVPDGPVPVIWDKTACAYCSMHLSDPRFAAQLTTEDGSTYFYDDPGCLFLHQTSFTALDNQIHARWFRGLHQDAWIQAPGVAFQRTDDTPMNFGFGAVASSSPDSLSLDEATTEVLAK